MRRFAILVAVPLMLPVGCSSTASRSGHARAPSSSPGTTAPTTTAAPTTLPIVSVAPATASGRANPAATGKVLMIKLYVGDLGRAEKFYGAVFGAKLALTIGRTRTS